MWYFIFLIYITGSILTFFLFTKGYLVVELPKDEPEENNDKLRMELAFVVAAVCAFWMLFLPKAILRRN